MGRRQPVNMKVHPIDQIKAGLQKSYGSLDFDESPILGTYGLVLLATDSRTGSRLAFKTIDVAQDSIAPSSQDIAYLQREFRKWLRLPPSRNVMTGLMVHSINITFGNREIKELPVMMMKAMAGSLEDWIGNPDFSWEEKLTASIQLFSGLDDLYKSGISGHGDLKPSNILYSKWSDTFQLENPSGWPSQSNPWRVTVADFGWADAWLDLGFTNKALREYMAPERLDGTFITEKSDVFAAGLIVAQLFHGEHPAPNLKKAKKSEGNWRRCVEQGVWEISSLASDDEVYELILSCLSYDPAKRPTAGEVLIRLSEVYEQKFAYPLTELMRNWKLTQSSSERVKQLVYVAQQSLSLGEKERRQAAFELIVELESSYKNDIYALEKWSTCASALMFLCTQDENILDPKTNQDIQYQAKHILEHFLSDITAKDIELLELPDDSSSVIHPFEWFAEIVGAISILAKIDHFDTIQDMGVGLIGEILLATLAYNSAMAKDYRDLPSCLKLLSEASDLYPTQPVFPYFRYLRIHDYLNASEQLIDAGSDLKLSNSELIDMARRDLARAKKLDPNWVAAQR